MSIISASTYASEPVPRVEDRAEVLRTRLIRQADACVACGMCLPVCPTYVDTLDEAESARGRIALVRGFAERRLTPGPQLVAHLEHCLQCQACERVCPAGVQYGALIDGANALLRARGAAPRLPLPARMVAWCVRSPMRLRLFGWWLALYRFSGLQRIARRSGLLRRLGLEGADRFARVRGFRFGWRRSYPARGAQRGTVALFTGCIANLVDRENLAAAVAALQTAGYRVEVPAGQRCCGAMDLHAGRDDAFAGARGRNLAVFEAAAVNTVVYIASGCGAVLERYGAESAQDSVRFVDIHRFLTDATDESDFEVQKQPAAEGSTYLHIPCSMRNATREQDAPRQLLQRAGVDFTAAPELAHCCGAAGTYSLRHPQLARDLGRAVLQQARARGCSTIATCNVGCALHLSALAKEEQVEVAVTHPIRLALSRMRAERGH